MKASLFAAIILGAATVRSTPVAPVDVASSSIVQRDIAASYPSPPNLGFLYEMYVECAPAITIPDTPSGNRGIYPIVGGSFKGPKISGK